MKKRYGKIILIVIVLAVLGLVTGYYFYNKGPLDVRKSKALDIEAEQLYLSFASDSVTAFKKYSGKILAVKGIVGGLSENQQGNTIVLLKSGVDGAFINCTLEEKKVSIDENKEITIKGICSGIGEGDADLGLAADVYLTRGYVQL